MILVEHFQIFSWIKNMPGFCMRLTVQGCLVLIPFHLAENYHEECCRRRSSG